MIPRTIKALFSIYIIATLIFLPQCGSQGEQDNKIDKVEKLIGDLKSKNYFVRYEAVRALGKTEDPRAIEPIIAAMNDKDCFVRTEAAEVLGELKDLRAIEALIVGINDKDCFARISSALSLGKLKDPRAVEPLIRALEETDELEFKKALALALAHLQDPRAVSSLIKELNYDHRWRFRESVAEALGHTTDPRAVKTLIELLQEQILAHEEAEVRKTALESLFQTLNFETTEPIVSALGDRNFIVRQTAAQFLGRIKDPKAVYPLIRSLKDPNARVRSKAALSLRYTQDPKAVEALIMVLKDNEPDVIGSAIETLGAIGTPRALEPIIAISNHGNESIRLRTAQALGNFNDLKATGPLIELLNDPSGSTREAAAEALGNIKASSIVPLLTKSLNDRRWNVRRGVAYALKVRGWHPRNSEERISYLLAIEKWVELAKSGSQAVQALTDALTIGPLEVRLGSIQCLGDIKDPSSVALLVRSLDDQNKGIREEVVRSLANIGGDKATNSLVCKLTDWYLSPLVANALSRLRWNPECNRDRIHLLVAQRKGSSLRNNWNMTREILLLDIESNDYRTIENALLAFIGIGRMEIMQVLIDKLNVKGNKIMAEAYLNCGQSQLRQAAKDWAKRHGYTISIGPGAHPIGWGSM